MSKIKIIMASFLLCLFLSKCQSMPIQVTRMIDSFQSLKRLVNDHNPLGWDINLSPNGGWLIQNINDTENVIRVISTGNPEISIQDDTNVYFGKEKTLQEWSPDSSKFSIVSSDSPGKCRFNNVVIYKIIDEKDLNRKLFKLPGNRYDCPGTYWSWDSLYLAVTDSEGHIYVLDSDAQLIQTIFPSQEGKSIQIKWTTQGMFASISHYDSEKNSTKTELWLINPDKRGGNKLLFTGYVDLGIVCFDPTGERLLLGVGAETVNEPKQLRLWVFDVKTNQVIKELALPGDVWYGPEPESVTSASWVAYIIGTPETAAQRKLYLFDWSKIELIDYGEATGLVGWRSNVNGFIIIKGKTGDYSIDVVTPK